MHALKKITFDNLTTYKPSIKYLKQNIKILRDISFIA